MIVSLISFAAMLALIFMRLPIAFAMILVGFVGFGILIGWMPAFKLVGQVAYDTGLNYELSVLPLFILMGHFVSKAGFSDELYAASNAFLRHRKGGLAMATVVAAGGFSAISGSSLATAATMSKVAMGPMKRYGYSDSLAAASVAAGGTLGAMIPPSVIMVIYGLATETNIGKLFIAGIIPGIIGILGYVAAVRLTVARRPESGPTADRAPWRERFAALRGVWGIVALFGLIMGGIYGGVFTTTEAAGLGAGGAFLLVVVRRRLTIKMLLEVLIETSRNTAALFFVLIGAMLISHVVNIAGLPATLTSLILDTAISPTVVIVVIILIYIVLGCVLESISMVLLTVPVFFPIVTSLGYDPIWFGVLVVMVVEIGMITPPVGMNVFVLASVQPDIKAGTVFGGLIPFVAADFIRLALLVAFPVLALFLPSLMG